MKVQRISADLVLAVLFLQYAETLCLSLYLLEFSSGLSQLNLVMCLAETFCKLCFCKLNLSFLLHSLPRGIFQCSLSEVTALCL